MFKSDTNSLQTAIDLFGFYSLGDIAIFFMEKAIPIKKLGLSSLQCFCIGIPENERLPKKSTLLILMIRKDDAQGRKNWVTSTSLQYRLHTVL